MELFGFVFGAAYAKRLFGTDYEDFAAVGVGKNIGGLLVVCFWTIAHCFYKLWIFMKHDFHEPHKTCWLFAEFAWLGKNHYISVIAYTFKIFEWN